METRRRYDEFDGYRGLAALAIVAYHTYLATSTHWADNAQIYVGTPAHFLLRNLDAGVSLFFVLSGLVIFLPFARAALDGTVVPARSGFLARRARRILPLYWTATLAVWLLGLSRNNVGIGALVANLTLTQQVLRLPAVIGPSWSLCHEVAFYLTIAVAAPPLCRRAAALPSRAQRAGLLWLVVALIITSSVAYKALLLTTPLPFAVRDWATWQPCATMDQFAFGMGLAISASYGVQVRRRGVWVLRGGALALLTVAARWRVGSGATDYARPGVLLCGLLCATGFALLLASTVLAVQRGPWCALLAAPALSWLGAISYSVYLLHEEPLLELLVRRGDPPILTPAAFLMNVVILAVLAIGLAAFTYRYIERPWLRGRAGRVSAPARRVPGRCARWRRQPAPASPAVAPSKASPIQ